MINLGWGALRAGYIDPARLVRVAGGTATQLLEPTAAAQWARMRDDCHAATGYWINPQTDGAISTCYRTFDSQVVAWITAQHGGPVAADPYGQPSNHMWARAIDMTGYRQPGVWEWLAEHAAEYGFSNATGKASGEDWHWECYTVPGTQVAGLNVTVIDNNKEEEDMSTGSWIRLKGGPIGSVKGDTVLFQADPLSPLVPISSNAQLAGFVGNGNKIIETPTADVQKIINLVGLVVLDPKTGRIARNPDGSPKLYLP